MPGLGAPIEGLLLDDVVDKAYELRPKRPFLPEKAVNWYCE